MTNEYQNIENILYNYDDTLLKNINQNVVIVCIGVPFIIFDSFGPKLGTKLKELNLFSKVYGTIQEPITGKNAASYIEKIHSENEGKVILAIDACFSENIDNMNKVFFKKGSISPASGMGRYCGKIGDYKILAMTTMTRDVFSNHISVDEIDEMVSKTIYFLSSIMNKNMSLV